MMVVEVDYFFVVIGYYMKFIINYTGYIIFHIFIAIIVNFQKLILVYKYFLLKYYLNSQFISPLIISFIPYQHYAVYIFIVVLYQMEFQVSMYIQYTVISYIGTLMPNFDIISVNYCYDWSIKQSKYSQSPIIPSCVESNTLSVVFNSHTYFLNSQTNSY